MGDPVNDMKVPSTPGDASGGSPHCPWPEFSSAVRVVGTISEGIICV